MSLKPGAQIGQKSREASLFNNQFVDLLKQLSSIQILNGNLVQGITTLNGSFSVGHGLGRAPLGFIVVSKSTNVQVWNDTVGSAPNQLLYLVANGVATISLWVF